MAIAVRSVATLPVTTALSGGNIILNKPSGLTAGDLMIACIGVNNSTPSTPSGWTEFPAAQAGSSTRGFFVYYKTASSGDAAASTFSFPSTGGTGGGVLYAITGAVISTIQGDKDTGAGDQTTVALTTTLTPTVANSLLIIMAVGSDSTSQSSPANYYITGGTSPTFTERLETQDIDNEEAWAVADAIYASATALTAYGWTDTASINGQQGSIIIIAPQQDGLGTAALHSADADAFSVTGAADTHGTAALHEGSTEALAPVALSTQPTRWTPINKS